MPEVACVRCGKPHALTDASGEAWCRVCYIVTTEPGSEIVDRPVRPISSELRDSIERGKPAIRDEVLQAAGLLFDVFCGSDDLSRGLLRRIARDAGAIVDRPKKG